jgi:Nucleotide-diphospho-sugar transferase
VTDQETKDLAEGMGLTTFYNTDIFGDMPTKAARSYGDFYFMKMMAAKVYCVQLISMLGHDVLFSDVDVVWYKNPLTWFHDPSNPTADVYFQDDGNHALFYAPYSANTGFYYVRNNVRTRYFFNSLLMAGDLIISTRSHQNALIALLNEHASMYGLKVKIWERNLEEFPGGFSFHRKRDFMKDVVQGKVSPIIFHMSWTKNKDNKIKFFEQMGEFYLLDHCQGVENSKIVGGGATVENCCAVEPVFKCHYRDKPSKYPCKESPPIDKNGKSFW